MFDDIYGAFEEHVKTGDTVWYSGDIVDPVEKIVVGPSRKSGYSSHCYEAVNSFWNKVYFDNQEAAIRHRQAYCAGYTDWLFGMS